MLLPELKKVAAGLGIKGASTMRKADLIAAISGNQSSGHPATPQKSAGAASGRPPPNPPPAPAVVVSAARTAASAPPSRPRRQN